jgi:hypothetical protein
MLGFLLALARLIVDIPCIAVSGGEDDEILYLDVGVVERCYERLSELEKCRVANCWQAFQSIVVRQNEVHRDAARLNVEMIRWIIRVLVNRDSRAEARDDAEPDEVEVLLDELAELTHQMPLESLAEVVAFARAQVSVA